MNSLFHKSIIPLSILVPSIAFSQSEQDLEKAAKKFEEAEISYRIQDYNKALEAYKESYILSKAPELLYNIAQCQRLLGYYQEAIISYKSFIRDVPDSSIQKNAENFIKELEQLIASGVTKEGLERASKISKEADGLYQIQNYQKSLDLYQESYLLSKQPEILYNIGECQKQLKKYEEAINSYNAFLTARPDSPQRAKAEERLKESQDLLAQEKAAKELAVKVTPQPNETPKTSVAGWYIGAGASAVTGLIIGSVGLSASRDLKDATELTLGEPPADPDNLIKLARRAKSLGYVADTFLLSGVALGTIGFISSKKQETKPIVQVTPSRITITFNF